MLTAKAAFVLSNSFSVRELLDIIDKDIREQAKNGKFQIKTCIEGPYMVTAVTKALKASGYEVTDRGQPDIAVKDKQWLRISWGFLSPNEH